MNAGAGASPNGHGRAAPQSAPRSGGALSLTARLLLAASVVLAAFLGLTGLALDKAFRASAEGAVHDRLQGQLYALLAAADPAPDGSMAMRGGLPEARLATPGSGLYGVVLDAGGAESWRSPSLLGTALEFPDVLDPGESRYSVRPAPESVYLLSFGVAWEHDELPRDYTFHVAESLEGLHAQVADFRRSLWGWLGGAALVLLAVQGSILRWSLAPLRRAAGDLAAIESGRHAHLEGSYPPELAGLTGNINALLNSERAQQQRYRASLADLAHSLKTPLAVLRGAAEQAPPADPLRSAVDEQVGRMREIVDYQLQRAGTSGRSALAAPVRVEQAVRQVAATVEKAHAAKPVRVDYELQGDPCFYGDRGDLLELLGNLLDNAYKYGRGRVRIAAAASGGGRRPGLRLSVEDDGPGIAPGMAQAVLERGVRASTRDDGHGIGLAVVRDVAAAYGGRVQIDTGTLGGARVSVHLPAP